VQLLDVPTPVLHVDLAALNDNIDAMSAVRPGRSLRPHVKAFKSTGLARHLADRGDHPAFCCATLREMEGMAAAGLGDDLLLANETLAADRLGDLVALGSGRITVAVDSEQTIAAAVAASRRGPLAVLVDVNVGLPRCGCRPDDAARLAEVARAGGLEVRGVMGYEGHVVGNPDRAWRTDQLAASMSMLQVAHDAVGGDVISAGGTGTYDLHDWATEVQAGSYLLMDTHYQQLGLPFRQALFVDATVISVNDEWAVADAGLKCFGMDHGSPTVVNRELFFSSDEHTTFGFGDLPAPAVGERVRMVTAHVDPTVAYHERMLVVDEGEVVDEWPVDLRNW
jgi:D-serine deaminase-like pyridoxal phosphate-dependent protein